MEGKGKHGGDRKSKSSSTIKLDDLGIKKGQSHRWQTMKESGERTKGGRPKENELDNQNRFSNNSATELKDLGISHNQSSRWQTMAEVENKKKRGQDHSRPLFALGAGYRLRLFGGFPKGVFP